MSNVKTALKAAKAALDTQNLDEAVTQARTVIASDAQNYFGYVFLGRALEKQGKQNEAEDAYSAATKIKPGDELAWKGLCSTLESQGSSKISKYIAAALNLAQVYAEASDKDQCQSTVDKAVTYAKQNGSRSDYKQALQIQLPTSPVFDFLEGRIPNPSHTYTRLAEITEIEERERINKEVGERRTRLGAKLTQVTADTTREVYSGSDLESIYEEIINWTSDDDTRRQYEEKLLQRAYDLLIVLYPEDKSKKRNQVLKLAHDMILIKHPFLLAWTIELEWKDLGNLDQLDTGVLSEYTRFFPNTGLSKVIVAHIGEERDDATEPKEDLGEEPTENVSVKVMNLDERLILLTDGLEDCKSSGIGNRIASNFFLQIGEFEICSETSRQGIELLRGESYKSGLPLQSNMDAMSTNLATSLVYFQSPKNHPEARKLFEDVLERLPNSTPALLGVGMIYEEQEEYSKAVDFLDRAASRDSDNLTILAEAAWCRALTGEIEEGLRTLETCASEIEVIDAKTRNLKSKISFRIGKCMWDLKTDKASRKDRNGAYARYLTSIKLNPEFAPAYSALGVYYADYSKDIKRARQCFQKAFELSPSEIQAAERLSRVFADDGDWELVEMIAQRVVDSGAARAPPGSKKSSVSWPYAALGVAQMGKQEFTKSVLSFQAALRISPNDYHSWVSLGESYSNCGRHNAALRALEVSLASPDTMKSSDDDWFARYMLANVNRDLGNFGEAINGYDSVLDEQKNEFGVLIAKLQTLVEQAWHSVETGFHGLATSSARSAILMSKEICTQQPSAFNLWKALGDACAVFTSVQSRIDILPHKDIIELLRTVAEKGTDLGNGRLEHTSTLEYMDQDGITKEALPSDPTSLKQQDSIYLSMVYSILSYKRAIQFSRDQYAEAVAWYNLGWGELRMYDLLRSEQSESRKSQPPRFNKTAVKCFKRAIELEAGNSEFWNALGIATTRLNPKVAQHSFVRSLHLNERSARTWTNLGTLFLLQNDHELAHNAFARAQSTDPSYSHAWIGEGLLALLFGDTGEALSHFTHAFEISDAAATPVKSLFAQSAFDRLLSSTIDKTDIGDLVAPMFALHQLNGQLLSVEPYRHLLALLYERVGDYLSAIEQLGIVCKVMEDKYEESESVEDLERFARAKADLARNKLASGATQQAVEEASTVIDLSEEQITRDSAQLTIDVAAGDSTLDNTEDTKPAYDSRTTILLEPWKPQGWDMLADGEDDPYLYEIALLNSLQLSPTDSLSPSTLSWAYTKVGTARNAQRAIMVCPWQDSGWLALDQALAPS